MKKFLTACLVVAMLSPAGATVLLEGITKAHNKVQTTEATHQINVTKMPMEGQMKRIAQPAPTAKATKAQARIPALPTFADLPVLYAVHYRTADWTTMSTLGGGIYSFHPGEPITYTVEPGTEEYEGGFAAFYAKGKFYVLDAATRDQDGLLTVYDANTWEVLVDHMKYADRFDDETNPDGTYWLRFNCCYDPYTDRAYIGTWGPDLASKGLLRFNVDTYEFEFLGYNGKFTQAMFIGPDHEMYGISYHDTMLHKIDKNTGKATDIQKIDLGYSMPAGKPSPVVTDPETGITYWSVVNFNYYESALYTLDTENWTATKIADYPGYEHFQGLFIPDVAAGAPASTMNNKFADGKVTFTVPTHAYASDEALGNDLVAVASVDGVEKTKSVTAGENVEFTFDVADGFHVVRTYVKNNAGNGGVRRYEAYVGEDVPGPVENLTYLLDSNKASLSWTAPTTSVHHGPVDDSKINYSVVRWPDGVTVADHITDTKFSETVPSRRDHYSYEIISYSGQNYGTSVKTDEQSGGTQYEVPFTENFVNQADFDSFKVIDANGDGMTWAYTSGFQYAVLWGNGVYDAMTGFVPTNNDDYLVSLPIQLKKGIDYRLTAFFPEISYNEQMTVLLATSRDDMASARKIDEWNMPWGYDVEKSFVFNVAEDGDYYVAFHSHTVGNSLAVYMDYFGVEIEGCENAPDAVTNLKAEAGAKGALSDAISFTAPTQTYSKGALNKITSIEIYRDDMRTPVKTFDNPTPGQSYSWTDNDVLTGNHTYRVIPFNDGGQGRTAKVTNWVGLDIPAVPANVKGMQTADTKPHPRVTWDATTAAGSHGGYVDTSNVKYRLHQYNEMDWSNPWPVIMDELTETDITLGDITPKGNAKYPQQEYIYYAVSAYNEAGSSDLQAIGLTYGYPYRRPRTESFPNGGVELWPWTLHATSYNPGWAIATGDGMAVKPYDNDGGMMEFILIDEDSNLQTLESPRFELKSGKHTQLSFYMWHGTEADKGDLLLYVYTNVDDAGFQKAMTVDYNNGYKGWVRHSLDLPTDANNVILGFGAYAYDASAALYIDKITVADGTQYEIAIENIAADKRVTKGETGHVTTRVANLGYDDFGTFTVTLTRDGEAYATKQLERLAANAVTDVAFDVPTSIKDGGNTFTFVTEVKGDNDADATNNTSDEAKMFITGSVYPTVTDLNGADTDKGIELTWTKPDNKYVEDVTDDFEDYEAFIIDGIGDWITYDGDGYLPVYFTGPSIPYAFEPQAYQVWNPELAGFSTTAYQMLTPRSGSQVLACWASSDGVSVNLENDDWLISSEILGGSDVSFWTRVPIGGESHKYEILYSTTDNEPENFEVVIEDVIEGTTAWQYHIYTLPVEAKYFAIRCCSGLNNRIVWFIDDLNYTPAYGAIGELKLNGYNVYRDDEKIGTTQSPYFLDHSVAPGTHSYFVTANWDKGESLASNEYSTTTGIADATIADARVRTGHGAILISGISGRNVEVYSIDGRKVYGTSGVDNAAVPATSGAYIVKIGNKAVKVLVD